MDPRLAALIHDHLTQVACAVALLARSGIARPTSNAAWSGNGLPQSGALQGGARYFKHGFGCAVHMDGRVIDFDFGDAGEINGFNANRLIAFAAAQPVDYRFADAGELKASYVRAVAMRAIVCGAGAQDHLHPAVSVAPVGLP